MTKKVFAQPEMMVVNMRNNDIVTNSRDALLGGTQNNDVSLGADRFRDSWDAGY